MLEAKFSDSETFKATFSASSAEVGLSEYIKKSTVEANYTPNATVTTMVAEAKETALEEVENGTY